jgi:hypothetical protein
VDLFSSAPDNKKSWVVVFSNQTTSDDTGVAVAICAAASSLTDYSVDAGPLVNVPANATVEADVTCPSDTVALGGGWEISETDPELTQGSGASAPLGTNGWRAFPSAGAQPTTGDAWAVCAAQPPKWAQVSSSYMVNPAGDATTATVACPKGTKVLGGGGFNSSGSALVNIGLTSSLSSLKGWSITENNNSASSESVDAWAVCAKASSS